MIETIYSSESRLRSPRRFLLETIADLRGSREVAWHLFARSLRSQYRQSFLGYFWILLPPVATMLLWVYLNWSKTLSIGYTDIPYPIYVLTGTMLWQVFSDALLCPLTQLGASRNLISKVRVPHEAILISGLGIILFNFLVRLLLLMVAMLVLHVPPSLGLLLAPFGIFFLILLGLTIGLLLAPIGLLYKDISLGLNVILGFAFFITPIVYPVPTKWPASLLATLNPVTPLLDATRNWLALGAVPPSTAFCAVSAATLIMSLVAWFAYRISAPHFISRF
jgi:homopolymeric O-antigen transport system permease protein